MLDPLGLELQTIVTCHVGAWELNPGPLEEQVFLTAEVSSSRNFLYV